MATVQAMRALSTNVRATAGPATWMAAPEPSSNPVPMEPPTATMAIWRAVNSLFSPCSCSVIGGSYNVCYSGLPIPVDTSEIFASADQGLSALPIPHRIAYSASFASRSSPGREHLEEVDPMADISKKLEKAERYLQRSKPEAALE